MADLTVLDVKLHDKPIGTLTYLGGERTLFAFDDDYITEAARPTLGLGFKDTLGELITEFRTYKVKLMPFFSNLLPEGYLRQYLAGKADIHPDREFSLIRALGRDLPGAVTVEHAEREAWSQGGDSTLEADGSDSADHEGVLRFSLAGVQLKFSAVTDVAGSLTIPASGVGGDWIVKLPSREYRGVPENEFSMMALARMVGISVPPVDLVSVRSITNLPPGIDRLGENAFIIERFDRVDDGSAIHIEDLAQVFGVYAEDKYKRASYRNIAQVLAAESDDTDIAEFFRRLTFNTLIGNGDMHLKNWSLIYPDNRNARLAPAYDLVSTIPYIPGDQAALKFSRSRNFTDYTHDELAHLTAKAGLPRKLVNDTVSETIQLFMERWSSEKTHLPMGADVVEAIDRHLATLPILQGGQVSL